MGTTDTRSFSAERPISTSADDSLRRSPFAAQLAERIRTWRGHDSLVIALYGPWGTGKTSLKNLVLERLGQQRPTEIKVLEFNAWYWTHHDHAHRAFFDELALKLAQADSSADAQRTVRLLKRYAAYLDTGSHVLSGLEKAAPKVIIATSLLIGIGGFSIHPAILGASVLAGAILSHVRPVLDWTKDLLLKIAESFAGQSARQRTLVEMKSDLRESLQKLNQVLLVVIDDIDRLPRENIRQMCQLVRANADFPNLVYLLLFDRIVVEHALRVPGQSGRDFLEKIVQVPIDLPVADQFKIERVLFSGLDQLLNSNSHASQRFDHERWVNLFVEVLKQEFDTLRDVYRFLNSLQFYADVLTGRHAFEVNTVDLIALEVLRVFRPNEYAQLWRAQNLLTSRSFSAGAQERERFSKRIAELVDSSPHDFRPRFKSLLRRLFPNIEWALGGSEYTDEFGAIWNSELRVCSPQCFARYFSLIPVGNELAEDEVARLVASAREAEDLTRRLSEFEDDGRLDEALAHLDVRAPSIAPEHSRTALEALLPFAERLSDATRGRTGISNHMRIVRIVRAILKTNNASERAPLIMEVFAKRGGLSVVHDLIYLDKAAADKRDPSRPAVFEEVSLTELTHQWLLAMSDRSKNDASALLMHPNIASMLWRWKEWGGSEEAASWVEAQTRDSQRLVSLLRIWCGQRSTQTFGDHYVNRETIFAVDSAQKWLDLRTLQMRIDELPSQLNDEDRAVITIAKDSIKLFLSKIQSAG